MVCVNSSGMEPPDGPDDSLSAEEIASLHQIRRDALADERELQDLIATAGLPADALAELTQRLTVIKAIVGGFLGDGGTCR